MTRTAAFFLLAAAALAAAHAAWIPLKAELAQHLLLRSWAAIRAGDATARPWPWADTRPAAVLRVPALGVEQLVLEGNSGRNLAFGPVFVDAAGGSRDSGGDHILSGHRDTHFGFLRELQTGDHIELEAPGGSETYVVQSIDVIDSRAVELVVEPGARRLSLVTCYPFDAASAGGPWRYVVTALPPRDPAVSSRRRSASSG